MAKKKIDLDGAVEIADEVIKELQKGGKAFIGSDIPRNPILTEYVNSLCINYPGLKLTEWMLFFFRMRSGRYGKIYGDLTPDYCSDAMKVFMKERNSDLEIYEKKLKATTKVENKDCCTYDEYLRMKEAGEIEEYKEISTDK